MRFAFIIILIISLSCSEKNKKVDELNKKINLSSNTQNNNNNSSNLYDRLKPFIYYRDSIFTRIKNSKDVIEADTIFNTFYEKCTQRWIGKYSPSNYSESYIDSLKRIIIENGFRISDDCEEGICYECNDDFLLEQIGKYLSPISREFYLMKSEDDRRGFLSEAGMIISFDELGNRIAKWENFLSANKNILLKTKIEKILNGYEHVYLIPMDYHNLFDSGENRDKLNPDILLSYKKFIQQNPTTEFGKYLSEYLVVLENNNYELNANVKQYLKTIYPDIY